ncbi:MAG: isoprenylcysteine carboxylmethyltransferase family protein [Nanoarchaeota archaeon]|nr:isoprenylcysteine carboxylmethyltransferase family protein [Nanoarchaeota archaeon]
MKELKIDIADYFLIFIIIGGFLHFLFPIRQIIFYPLTLIGLFLFFIGWIPNVCIGIYFRKIGTSIPSHKMPKKLITSGYFRFSRNPVYLGIFVSLLGEAIFLGSIVTFIVPVLFFILVSIFNVPFEEKNLEKQFGKKYQDYKKKVRRWI